MGNDNASMYYIKYINGLLEKRTYMYYNTDIDKLIKNKMDSELELFNHPKNAETNIQKGA